LLGDFFSGHTDVGDGAAVGLVFDVDVHAKKQGSDISLGAENL
jgi:hypothetical protein